MFFLFDHQLIYCKKVPRVILPCWMGLLRAAVAGLRLRARSSCPEKTSHTRGSSPRDRVYRRPFPGQALWAKVGGGRRLRGSLLPQGPEGDP